MIIVPDELSDTLNCDICHKFLSVGPVKVYPNRSTKCGRCSESEDCGAVSQYGLVLQQCIFKCVNRFDGCKKMLSCDQVAEHESACHSKTYDCPVCPKTTEIPTFLLVDHFSKEHAEYFLKVPSFKLNSTAPGTKTYLYRVKDNLFFIEIVCTSIDELILKAFFLGDSVDASGIEQKFKLWFGDDTKEVETESKRCNYFGTTDPEEFKLTKPEVNVIDFVFELSFSEKVYIFNLSLSESNKESSATRSDGADFSLPITKYKEKCSTSSLREDDSRNDNMNKSLEMKLKKALSRTLTLSPGARRYCPDISLNSNSSSLLIDHDGAEVTVIPYCYNCSLPEPEPLYYFEFKPRKYQSICETCEKLYQKISPKISFHEITYMKPGYVPDDWDAVRYSCIWGCTRTLDSEQILEHEIDCPKQSQQDCPVLFCTYRCKLFKLEKHFETKHPHDNLSLGSIALIHSDSLPQRWHIWAQFAFLSIKVSINNNGGQTRKGKPRKRWTVTIDPSMKDNVLEPKCIAYSKNRAQVFSSSSEANTFDFLSTCHTLDFLCYFEAKHPSLGL